MQVKSPVDCEFQEFIRFDRRRRNTEDYSAGDGSVFARGGELERGEIQG